MTPLVDLGFLLITFFIFTATISQPCITRLVMPKDGEPTPVAESKSLTLLLDREKIFAYEGQWEKALAGNAITETTYDLQKGIGEHIRQKQNALAQKEDLMVLIKPFSSASYQQVIAALDEMQINVVKKYALLQPTESEEMTFRKP